jgi:hypothetical protein
LEQGTRLSNPDLSKLDLKNVSVQQPLFLNRCPLLFVIGSEAEGSAVPRTSPGNTEYDAQPISGNEPVGAFKEKWQERLDLKNVSVQQPLFLNSCPFLFVIPSEAEGSAVPRTSPGNTEYDTQPISGNEPVGRSNRNGRRDDNLFELIFRVSRRGPRNCRSLGFARDDK